jgi:hypothetical protein
MINAVENQSEKIESKVEEIEADVVMPPPPKVKVPRSTKKWSENKQKFFYKPLDPGYSMRHYWKHKRDMECGICGTVVTTQMHKHIKSRRCILVKRAIQKTIGSMENEAPPKEE